MQYKHITGVLLFVILAIPFSSVHADVYSDPYNILYGSNLYQGAQQLQQQQSQNQLQGQLQGLQNQVQGLRDQVKGLQPQKPPVVLQPVVIPPSATATLGTNAVECTLNPANCKAALNAQTKCVQGNGRWTSYSMDSVLWPGSYCQCNAGYELSRLNGACYPSVTTSVQTMTFSSHSSGLTTAQISSIISLLQAFGADAKTIASVQVALQ
ncbi:MAG: hypothetical protein WC217_02850 [Candidatus Paceibacterota bacterium]|jgi:hypothetical protein